MSLAFPTMLQDPVNISASTRRQKYAPIDMCLDFNPPRASPATKVADWASVWIDRECLSLEWTLAQIMQMPLRHGTGKP